MCGIFILLDNRVFSIEQLGRLFKLIDNRGPDYSSTLVTRSHGHLDLRVKSSVLHLRGDVVQIQPVIDLEGNILMFNGQIYKFKGHTLDLSLSDTSFLAQELQRCTNVKEIVDIFTQIEGPFAFVYWDSNLRTLIYGRDLFGRKSLCALEGQNRVAPIILSSIIDENLESDDLSWSEVSCTGLHCIDFNDVSSPERYTFHWDLDRIYSRTMKCAEINKSQRDQIITINYLAPLNDDPRPSEAIDQASFDKAVNNLEIHFLKAVKSRFEFNNKTCLACRKSNTVSCCHAKVAVAFSGGVDSTVIALALDKIMDEGETIDLITVAFKPDSPDRLSVGSAYRELKQLSPNRNWRLILCDITIQELQQFRQETIRNLILPCDTVFDDGIGSACWFVGRGHGRAIDKTTTQKWFDDNFEIFLQYDPLSGCCDEKNASIYTCPASMLYVGSSIDEQLGGYSSHRAAWCKRGIGGLLDEISFLMRRLSSRNLGRDDRAYSDHGRDLKLPFLDFEFVSFLNQLTVSIKMNLGEPADIGPKKILRFLALKWGLIETGRRVKRAMQFGTRIANLEHNKEKGNDICTRLRGFNRCQDEDR